MKITVYPSNKSVFNAVSWYAKHSSPNSVDSHVQLIGEDFDTFLDGPITIGTFTVTPASIGLPVASGYDMVPKVYSELELEGPVTGDSKSDP